MLPETNLGEKTRRAVLKAAGAALGVAAVGTSIAHPGGENSKFYGGTEGYLGDNVADAAANAELVGYHSAGGVGPASLSGQPEDAHYGAMTEFRIHDDLAFVGFFSGRGEDSQRGMGIFDVSDFTRAERESDLENAELTLLSIVRNDNTQAAVMDVKVSDDGERVFMAKQTVTALFGEGHRSQPSGDGHSNAPGAGSLAAVDVSDPGNPEVTSEVELSHWSVGPHNCWYHQIGGDEYVFTVHGTSGRGSKTNVFEFDRSTGQLYQVNAWSWDTNVAQGEYGTDSNFFYHHDIQVQEDPKTGIPLAYLHCWDAGLRILDVSDPRDVQEVGVFEQNAAHHAVPAPALIDGKRLAVSGHENPSSNRQDRIEGDGGGETGRYNLIDTDPLDLALFDDPDDGGDPDVEKVYLGVSSAYQEGAEAEFEEEPLTRAPYSMYAEDDDAHVVRDGDENLQNELDDWVLINGDAGDGWGDAPGFEEEARLAEEDPEGDDEDNPGEYDGFTDFRISTHNLDMDTKGRVYAGHYHAGMRAFQIVSPGEDGGDAGSNQRGGSASPNSNARDSPAGENADPIGTTSADDDGWQLAPVAYFRRGKEIPEDAAMSFDDPSGTVFAGLTASTPFFWNGVTRNGVVFSSGINAGPHVMRETHDGAAEVGWDTPLDVDIEREADVPVTVSGQALRFTIRVDSDEDVIVRDAVPVEWDVLEEYSPDVLDVHEIEGYRKIVTLEVGDGDEASYMAESPDDFGGYTFGPVEYARADEDGFPIVDSHYGGGNSTTNRLWRKDNAAVESTGNLGL